MKIKEISTRQFAGIKNKKLSFNEGLNIVVGENESGKSTIIEVLKQTIYRRSELNKREDKDFIAKFMPSGSKGDVVDGKIVFIGSDGEYELQKKWGSASYCELVDESGNITADEKTISKFINDELLYKKGLYDDIVFASQKDQESVVEHILKKLDKKNENKQDIVSTIASEGVTSAGGISPDDIEKIITENITRLDAHWDFSTDGPMGRRGIDNPWIKEVGEILNLYYEKARIDEKLRQTEQIEKAMDLHNSEISGLCSQKTLLEQEKDEYERYAEAIAAYRTGMELKNSKIKEKSSVEKDKEEYPQLLDYLSKALHLKKLSEAKTVIDRYKIVKKSKDEFENYSKMLSESRVVTQDDVKKLEGVESTIRKLKGRLNGLNVVASIEKYGNTNIEVKSILTGNIIDSEGGQIGIDEAFEIFIPGVAKITIAPGGIDVNSIEDDLKRAEKEQKDILERTGSTDLDHLRELRDKYEELNRKTINLKEKYEEDKGQDDFNSLETGYREKKDLENELADLNEKISSLCGRSTLDAFIAVMKQRVEGIEKKYDEKSPIDGMNMAIENLDRAINKLQEQEKDAENIPEKYKNIEDPGDYKNKIKNTLGKIDVAIKNHTDELHREEKELGNESIEDLRIKKDDAENSLTLKKQECKRWMHILEVLKSVKESVGGDRAIDDVQKRFSEYLSVMSKGGIKLDRMDENMDLAISSKNAPMSYEILSEGTKGTIALAFRLAMLDHLFPDGGGLAVFDDPFTEMDEERTKIACTLVRKFAENGNQVIFTTCDSKYRNLMSGNVIEV